MKNTIFLVILILGMVFSLNVVFALNENININNNPSTRDFRYHDGWQGHHKYPYWGRFFPHYYPRPFPNSEYKFCRSDRDCHQIVCIRAPCPVNKCIYGICRMINIY